MNELIQTIVSSLGINEDQAKGGAGLLFKLAKEKLGGGDFSKITDAIGSVDDLISAAPEGGGLSSMLGGLASKVGAGQLGDLAELAGGFKSLDLGTDKIGKVAELVLNFVKDKGGDSAAIALKSALKV